MYDKIYICGGTESQTIFEKINHTNKVIQNHIVPYTSNTYILRQTTNIYDKYLDHFFIICWTDVYKEEGYNSDLGLLSVSDTDLVAYDNTLKTYYSIQHKNRSLNFIQKNLYLTLNELSKTFMKEYRSDILYNNYIKYMYMVSLEILFKQNNISYLFIDMNTTNKHPTIDVLLQMMYDRKEENDFENVLQYFKHNIKESAYYILYKDFNEWFDKNCL